MDPEAFITNPDGSESVNPNYTPLWLAHPLGRIVGSTGLVKQEIDAMLEGKLDPEDFTTAEEIVSA